LNLPFLLNTEGSLGFPKKKTKRNCRLWKSTLEKLYRKANIRSNIGGG
jgi:hypothetical protein